ncbi:hypothetical protein [Dolichospermum circinale]|uniref:hypothetical protein n=2 Tax=Dolichospermum circinale TaxID=109265 RepID=UPI00232ADCB8|nr:hypothetical protein [Dolichospermum circinale]MDB9473250.1 hypothetical protein [Dolichospermum circinale CS-537/11]MDB9480731.1 hypothetical protein [Dolichospermum circinale CS-537/03]MDB9483755.1 hypothetical protein [Dolichospermum circinale CS-537/05]
MKKLHKLLMTTTVIVSIFGWNIHSTQAQNSREFKAIDSIKDKSILIAQSQPSISDTVQFAVNAIHKLRQQGKINLRRDSNYTFGDIRIEIDNVKPELLNQNLSSEGNFNPFANWITIKNLKQDISVTVQVVGSNSYKSIGYSTPKRVPGKSIDLCCTIYNPR